MIFQFGHRIFKPIAAQALAVPLWAFAALLLSGCRSSEIIPPVGPQGQGNTQADSTMILLYPSGSADASKFIGVVDDPSGGGSLLVEADVDGGRLVVLYRDSLEKRLASLSPEGKRVVYLAAPAGRMWYSAHVWVVDADGSDPRDLTPGGGNWDLPCWSRDGRCVVFSGLIEDSGEIHHQIVLADAATGKTRLLTRGRSDSFGPFFLADNRRIAFRSDRIRTAYGGKVFLMDVEGGPAVPVDTSQVSSSDPLPSPVRPEVLFYWGLGMEDDRGDYMIDADSVSVPADPSQYRLIHRENIGSSARWSPDGSMLHFLFAIGSRGADLFVMSRNGGGLRRLTSGYDIDQRSHVWSRDSRRIFFIGREISTGICGNFIYDFTTTSVRKLKFAFK